MRTLLLKTSMLNKRPPNSLNRTKNKYYKQGCFIEGYAVKQDFVVSFQSENRVHGVIKPPCNTRTLISVSMIPVESNVIKTRRL